MDKIRGGIMNSEEAVLKARDFFEKTRGMKAYLFNIDSCIFENELWTVSCRFIGNPFDGNYLEYAVDDNEFGVQKVSRTLKKVE